MSRAKYWDWQIIEGAMVPLLPQSATPGVAAGTVEGAQGEIFSRTLLQSDKDFASRGGHLIVRDRRWIAGYIMSGRQHVEVELNEAGRHVVAQVEEMAYGVMFVIFPVVGTARHWYRFERLR